VTGDIRHSAARRRDGVVPFFAPFCGVAGHAYEVTQSGREDGLALVDDVLGIAQEIREADLIVGLGPAWAP